MKQKLLHSFVLRVCLLVAFFASAVSGAWADTYEQLTSIANIDESAQYVLGIEGTGFHYGGTSSWGKTDLPTAQTPIYYTLTKANDGNSFTAKATISGTTYYLQIPTSNAFSMATSTGTNTDIIIGTTQVSGTNYAVANKTTTARHLRINGTSGLRSYAGTTGSMAFFYKVVTATSTYKITAQSNNDSYGTVSLNGTTITATPEDGYRVSTTTPYTVTSGTATVTQEGNLFHVAASSDCTVTINFEEKPTVSGYTIDFENDLENYIDWTFTNAELAANGANNNINAHDGTHYGTTGGKTTASIQTKETIALPGTFTCYVSKQSSSTASSTWYIQVSSDGSTWINVESKSATSMTAGTWVEFTANLDSYSDVYVRLYYDGSTAVRNVDDISITMRDPNAKTTPTVTIDATGLTTDIAGSTNVAAGTITATVTSAENTISTPAVTWSSSNTDVATVDANTGAVTLIAVGTTTITASFAGNDDYNEASETYELTVTNSMAPGGEANPYTVAQALTAIQALPNNNATTEHYYISGIVSAFYGDATGITTSSSKRYYISDDGTTTTQLMVYSGKGLNNVAFSSDDDLLIGDRVTIYGAIQNYQGNTPEIASGNYIVSLTRKASSNLAFSEATASVNLEESFTAPTLTYADGVTGITYSSSVPTVATVDENTGAVTILTAGETVITASFAGDANFKASEASYTLTVVDPSEPVDICTLNSITPTELTVGDMGSFTLNATFRDGVAEGTDYVISWASSNTSVLDLSDETYEAKAAGTVTITVSVIVDDNTQYNDVEETFTVTVSEPKTYVALVADLGNGAGKALTSSIGSQDVDIVNGKVVNGEADNISWYITAKNTTYNKIQAKANDNYLAHSTANKNTNLTTTADYSTEDEVLWKETTKGKFGSENGRAQAVQWYITSSAFKNYAGDTSGNYIAVEDYTFADGDVRTSLTADSWGTICVPYTVAADDMAGAEFYSIVGKTEDGSGNLQSISLTKEEGALVAGHSYLFKATAEKLVVAYSGDKVSTPAVSNGLIGAEEETAVAQGKYILKNNQLYLVDTDNVYIRGNRAYIDASQITEKPAGVKAFTLYVGNTPTGINALNAKDAQTPAYNLAGQRVQKTTKGLYIVGGKKVVVK